MITSPSRVFLRTFLVSLVLLGAFFALPARADIQAELDAAKARLATAQGELDKVTAAWQQAESRLAQAEDAVRQTEREIARLTRELADLRARLNERARSVFISGGSGGALEAILDSASFADFADKVEFAASVAQGDADLANEAEVKAQELTFKQGQLEAKAKERSSAAAELNASMEQLDARLGDLQQTVASLQARWKKQQAALNIPPPPGDDGTVPVTGTGAIQTCPVAGPNSFVDSFGWPRPGGRSHEGIDLISPYGTPIVAVRAGNAVRTPNTLGGNAVIVYHDGGDWTYYAHMSSYGAAGQVSAGQVIGYVGATGDTVVNHLHFEYHPGGGGAVNPYSALVAVC